MIKVKVIYTGVCGSDINHIKNKDTNIPIELMGHEIVGKVMEETGIKVKCGDWVVVNPFICNDCNHNFKCAEECYLHCSNCQSLGKHLKGGFSGEITVPEENLIYIPQSIAEKYLMTLVDPAAVTFHSFYYLHKIDNGKILIIGSGTLACLTAIILKQKYPDLSIDINIKDYKRLKQLEFLKNKNINIYYDSSELQKNKYDIVYETVGGKQIDTLKLAIQCTRNNGQIIVLGVFYPRIISEVNLNQVFFKQISIKGINSYCKKFNEFKLASEWIIANSNELRGLITTIERNISPLQLKNNILEKKYKGEIKVITQYD